MQNMQNNFNSLWGESYYFNITMMKSSLMNCMNRVTCVSNNQNIIIGNIKYLMENYMYTKITSYISFLEKYTPDQIKSKGTDEYIVLDIKKPEKQKEYDVNTICMDVQSFYLTIKRISFFILKYFSNEFEKYTAQKKNLNIHQITQNIFHFDFIGSNSSYHIQKKKYSIEQIHITSTNKFIITLHYRSHGNGYKTIFFTMFE